MPIARNEPPRSRSATTRSGSSGLGSAGVTVVLRFQLELLPAGRGGRRRPIADGYRASLSFGRRRRGDAEPVVHDAVLVLEGAETLAPGDAAVARAWVLLGDELPRALDEGAVFTLLEGDRIVGRAELLGRYEDPSPHALRDLTAAKARVLRPVETPAS